MNKLLTKKLETLLLLGCKQVGGYDPDEVDAFIGEQLTVQESKTAYAFLTWITEKDKHFGSGTIRERFAEWRTNIHDEQIDAILTEIAKKHLQIPTLETQRSGVDFQEVSVWGVKAALRAAFEEGKKTHEE